MLVIASHCVVATIDSNTDNDPDTDLVETQKTKER